ncbi:hypothetical protein RQP46_010502 [Phenoliferia psychrophenolica]
MSASKRQKGNSGLPINVVLADDTDALGPAFALFPSATPPPTTPFTLYSQGGTVGEGPTVLAAETPDMEYDSRNQMGVGFGGGDGQVSGEGQGYSVEYMLGVHNPRNNTLTLHAAPLHSLSTSVKALKHAPASITSTQFTVQKALLGTTFGTKKAIRSINAQARNKLDASSFGTGSGSTSALQSLLQDSIATSTTSLPTSSAIEHSANLSRPIPPPNFDATKPDEVYAVDSVVSDAELAQIHLEPIVAAMGVKERNALLPYRRSQFITNRMRELVPNRSDDAPPPSLGKKDKLRLKLLVHLSHLFAFRHATQGGGRALDLAKLKEKMSQVDEALVAPLVERYSESMKTGGAEERKVTTGMELKLLGYMLVLVLKVDGWSTDVATIANDFGMGAPKVQEIFKSLGCQMMTPSADERAKLIAQGSATTDAEAKKAKRAVLKVPLVFPTERRGIPKR